MDADKLVEAVARGIFPADYDAMKYEASTYADKPNGQSAAVEVKAMQASARAALAAVARELADYPRGLLMVARDVDANDVSPYARCRLAALLRALADVAEARR